MALVFLFAAHSGFSQAEPASTVSTSAPLFRSTSAVRVYAEMLSDTIRKNIDIAEPIEGNPLAEVEIRMQPDGSITNIKLVKSSGVVVWDQAVTRAIERTERLPLDKDGKIPPIIIIAFRPKSGS